MQTPFFSVVIPCYDEMANLRKGVLNSVEDFLKKKKVSYEIIVVDDGSKDGSVSFIQKYARENANIHLIQNNHLGKAGTVTTGMLAAKGKYVLFTDMDQATPIEEIDRFLPFFEKGYDIVIGSRSGRKGSPWTRKILSTGLIVMRTLIVGLGDIHDTNCGFKMFSQKACQHIFQKVYDMHHGFKRISGSAVTAGFDVELLLLAEKMGYKIKEVPVEWLYVESRRVSPVRDAFDGIKSLISIRLSDMRGKYTI